MVNLRMFIDSRRVRAKACYTGHNCVFLETAALPEEIVSSPDLYDHIEFARAFSQWRVDFPDILEFPILSDKEKIVIAVLEKIITRGRFTMTSPFLENDFRKAFLNSQKLSVDVLYYAFDVVNFPLQEFRFDSDDEKKFYYQTAKELLGDSFPRFVHPQIGLDTLTKDRGFAGQRVDFFIAHPKLDVPVVVEIDGPHHLDTTIHDEKRNTALYRSGCEVVRVKRIPSDLKRIQKKLKDLSLPTNQLVDNNSLKFLYALKIAHQVQVVLILALKNGILRLKDLNSCQIISDVHRIGLFTLEESLYILEKAVDDFMSLLKNVIKTLFGEELEGKVKVALTEQNFQPEGKDIFISFTDKSKIGPITFHVRNVYFPFHFTFSPFSSPPYRLERKPSEKDLEFFLKYIFRKEFFWEGQYEGIVRVLQGKDALVLLPTGGGKSLIYQLSSMLLPGVTFVIDPIISLMDDQVYNLRTMGVDRALALHSNLEIEDKYIFQNLASGGNYLFVFISPERLRIEDFRTMVKAMIESYPVPMVVIDEVHCVSEWGHDFRPSYLSVARFSKNIFSSKYSPPILGLTGTASNAVLKDVMRILGVEKEALITPKTFDRKELEFFVIKCAAGEKNEKLINCLKEKLPLLFKKNPDELFKPMGEATHSGIIFCPFVNGDHGVKKIHDLLKKEKLDATIYSGKPPIGFSEEHYRKQKVENMMAFKQNRVPLIVATKSFGMGIDKPNIRYTIHYSVPQSIEQFYQEAGRAGRDKQKAYSFLLVQLAPDWRNFLDMFYDRLHNDYSLNTRKIRGFPSDDLNKLLWFHTNSFKGKNAEIIVLEDVLEKLGDISKPKEHELSLPENEGEEETKYSLKDYEKAVYHLSKIGIVEDYLVNYASNSIKVKLSGAGRNKIIDSYIDYVKSYLPAREKAERKKISRFNNDSISLKDFVKNMAILLINFVYDTVVRQKLRMMREMLIAAYDSKNGEEFRKRIIDYLETVEYTEDIEAMLGDVDLIHFVCEKIINDLLKPKDAEKLRGQVTRYLESYPDHPGLLILRALSEFLVQPSNMQIILQDLNNAIKYSLEEYSMDFETVARLLAWSISKIKNENNGNEIARFLINLSNDIEDEEFLITITQHLTADFKWITAWKVLEMLYAKAKKLVSMGVEA